MQHPTEHNANDTENQTTRDTSYKLPYDTLTLESIDSTSRFLKEYVAERSLTKPLFCTTKIQTAGYGQQHRQWMTNEKSAIFSLAYPLPKEYQISGLLSLHIAALLHQCLHELIPDKLALKWPNDLMSSTSNFANEQGKVAGMLIELVPQKSQRTLIIGIGINRDSPQLTDGSSSVSMFNLDALFATFFQNVQPLLQQSSASGAWQNSLIETLTFADYWQTHDFFKLNETVRLMTGNTQEIGRYQGINSNGQAQIEIDNRLKTLTSGLSSIRKMEP